MGACTRSVSVAPVLIGCNAYGSGVMLHNGCSTAKVACNSSDGTSGFEFEPLESCGFYPAFDLCPQGIACESVAPICG